METREGHTGYKEKLFSHEDSQGVAQVAQGGSEVSALGGFQALTR